MHTSINIGRAPRLLGKPWQAPRGPALLQSRRPDRETKKQTERLQRPGLSGVFFFTADTAANKRASCNTVHLEN